MSGSSKNESGRDGTERNGTERNVVVPGSDFKVPFQLAKTSTAGNSANRKDEIADG